METSQRVKIRWKKKPKHKNGTKKEAPPGFEPAPRLPIEQKVKPRTTGPCDYCTICPVKLIVLKYFCLPFTLFELVEEYLSWIQRYIWGKIAEISISKPFRIISVFIHSRAYNSRSMSALVYFRCSWWSSGRRYSLCCKPVKPEHYSVLRSRILGVLLTLYGKMT